MSQSFEEYLLSDKNRYFKYWIFKKPGLNYYGVPGPYVTEECSCSKISNVYALPDGDLMIEFCDDDTSNTYKEFFKLSEITLALSDMDQDE